MALSEQSESTGETLERVSSVTYDSAGNAVPESPAGVSSATYDPARNVLTEEQGAAAKAEGGGKGPGETAAPPAGTWR